MCVYMCVSETHGRLGTRPDTCDRLVGLRCDTSSRLVREDFEKLSDFHTFQQNCIDFSEVLLMSMDSHRVLRIFIDLIVFP